MIKLSQRDSRWAYEKIGKSNSTIGDYGCTITCISMASDWFGCYQEPDWMAQNLKFLVDKVIWSSIAEKTCFKFVWRFYGFKPEMINEAIAHRTKICLLQVYNRHWVLATRKVWGGYWVIDPWTGGYKFYSNTSISGGAILDKK